MRITPRFLALVSLLVVIGTVLGSAGIAAAVVPPSTGAAAVSAAIGIPNAKMMRTIREAPALAFSLAGGVQMRVTSLMYDRAQVAPLVEAVSALPHGSELSKLKLYAATNEEIDAICGAETMACYDPVSEQMAISAQSESIDGISRESVIAHEYGHHIANNRAAGIWPAFDAGTLRWSTYEQVCERRREGLAFPGNEGVHYWENPGEAFAQSYSELMVPTSEWNYSPLFQPNETALRKLREDVLEPVEPRHSTWRVGQSTGASSGIAEALPVGPATLSRVLRIPYDGRVHVRLHSDGAHYRLALVDPETHQTVAEAGPSKAGATHLQYADCGHRELELVTTYGGGSARPFVAEIVAP
jgi:hypothetical protein